MMNFGQAQGMPSGNAQPGTQPGGANYPMDTVKLLQLLGGQHPAGFGNLSSSPNVIQPNIPGRMQGLMGGSNTPAPNLFHLTQPDDYSTDAPPGAPAVPVSSPRPSIMPPGAYVPGSAPSLYRNRVQGNNPYERYAYMFQNNPMLMQLLGNMMNSRYQQTPGQQNPFLPGGTTPQPPPAMPGNPNSTWAQNLQQSQIPQSFSTSAGLMEGSFRGMAGPGADPFGSGGIMTKNPFRR